MSVYDINGAELATVYDIDGTVLAQAYDIDGNALIDSRYAIENVIDYYRQSTLSVASEVSALSDDWQSFVFITDPHGSRNKQHSQAIGMYLLDNTPATMLVLNGDYSVVNWSQTEYANYMRPFLESNLTDSIYAVCGNHERLGDTFAEAKACIYSDFLADKTNIHGQLDEIYYYLDDVPRKTRYMFLNTSDGSGVYNMSSTQISWISQNVILPATDWSLVVIGHVNLAKMGGVTYENEANGADIVSAIENCNGSIVGYFCGHQHIDLTEKIGNIQHTTLTCDKFENSNYYGGLSYTQRVADTVTEQTVSVISINTQTKNVVVRRVGAGWPNAIASLHYSYGASS